MKKNHRLLSVKETAERLGISPKTIYNRLSRNAFPITPKRFLGRVCFLEADLDAFLEAL